MFFVLAQSAEAASQKFLAIGSVMFVATILLCLIYMYYVSITHMTPYGH